MDAAMWDARYSGHDLVWGLAPNLWVAEICRDLPPGRAIDLACGEGRNALWLASLGWAVTGVDFSGVALQRAADLAAQQPDVAARLTWVQADLSGYQAEPGSADLVLLAYFQVPAAVRRSVVRSAAAGLATAGTLLVVGHDSRNLTDGFGGPQYPDVLFTAEDVIADLDGVGPLEVLRAERVIRPVDTSDGPRQALDALLVARQG